MVEAPPETITNVHSGVYEPFIVALHDDITIQPAHADSKPVVYASRLSCEVPLDLLPVRTSSASFLSFSKPGI